MRGWTGTVRGCHEELGQFLGYGKARTAARHVMSRILNDHETDLEDWCPSKGGMDLNWLINGVGEIKNIEEADNQSSQPIISMMALT